MKSIHFYLAGAAVAVASAALIVDYSVRKKKEETPFAGLLVAGITGLFLGAAIAYKPEKEAKKALTVDDLLDDGDEELMHQNISELMDKSVETGKKPQKIRKIEVDEETSIEDFEL